MFRFSYHRTKGLPSDTLSSTSPEFVLLSRALMTFPFVSVFYVRAGLGQRIEDLRSMMNYFCRCIRALKAFGRARQ